MATIVNDPDYAGSAPAPAPSSEPITRPAASPRDDGKVYSLPTSTGSGDNVKYKGSDGADRINSIDLLKDSDHIIKAGAGDDVFSFRQDTATNPELRNAVVDMGEGNDTIILANALNDYKVTFRDNGSIKFEFIGDGGDNNAAITFQSAENFTFRNIDVDPNGGQPTYYEAQTYTLEALKAAYGIA